MNFTSSEATANPCSLAPFVEVFSQDVRVASLMRRAVAYQIRAAQLWDLADQLEVLVQVVAVHLDGCIPSVSLHLRRVGPDGPRRSAIYIPSANVDMLGAEVLKRCQARTLGLLDWGRGVLASCFINATKPPKPGQSSPPGQGRRRRRRRRS